MHPIAEKLKSMKGWLKFLGILSIAGGALYALTIVGIIFAWLPIWIGVVLYQAGERADRYIASEDEAVLVEFMGKLNTYFTILGIAALVGFGLSLVFIVIALIMGFHSHQLFNHFTF